MCCDDCRVSDAVSYSNHFHAFLCDGCFDQRCFDEGEPVTLEDLEDINDQIVRQERLS